MHDVSLADVAALLPLSRGRPVHHNTILKWITSGVRGIRLDAVKIGGRWYTSAESLKKFSVSLTDARKGAQPRDVDADRAADESLARIRRRFGINVNEVSR